MVDGEDQQRTAWKKVDYSQTKWKKPDDSVSSKPIRIGDSGEKTSKGKTLVDDTDEELHDVSSEESELNTILREFVDKQIKKKGQLIVTRSVVTPEALSEEEEPKNSDDRPFLRS